MKSNVFSILGIGILALLMPFFQMPASAGGTPILETLIDTQWQWTKSRYNNDTEAVPKNPEKYHVTFSKDGSFSGLADCNRIRGTYTLSGGQITLGPIISTRAMCPPDSLDAVFLKDLGSAAILFFRNGTLYIDLAYHSGTMTLVRAPENTAKKQGAENAGETRCKDPRPEMCTADHNPVCARKKDNSTQSYSNGCTACSNPDVVSYRKGECL